jgi:hypothetical protein
MKLFSNPLLLDYIKVCCKLPQDERAQLEAFTGQPYDVDGAALGNFSAPGFKFAIKEAADAEPICVGGFVPQRPGVWRDFMLNTPEAFEQHWFSVTRLSRRTMDWMLGTQGHRIECIVPEPRLRARPQIEDWYRVLGYNREALLYGYCANGADAVIFSRVRH